MKKVGDFTYVFWNQIIFDKYLSSNLYHHHSKSLIYRSSASSSWKKLMCKGFTEIILKLRWMCSFEIIVTFIFIANY